MTSAPKRAWEFSAVRTASTRPVRRSSNCATSVVVPRSTATPRPARGSKAKGVSSTRMAASHWRSSMTRSSSSAHWQARRQPLASSSALRRSRCASLIGCVAFQHVHAAAAATALSAAGEFYPLGKKQVAQSGSRRSGQLRLHGPEGDAVCRFVRHGLRS